MTFLNNAGMKAAAGLGLLLAIAGCALNHGPAPSAGDVAFPDPVDAWPTDGSYPNLANLRQVHPGQSKDAVYRLIGRPQFSEGLFGVHIWNYFFQLPTGEGGYEACQFQIHYDDDMRIDGTYWRRNTCRALVDGHDAPAPAPVAKTTTLSADTTFGFDSVQLSASGQQRIDRLAQRIGREIAEPHVVVTGYTDRLGAAGYNQRLSARRAAAVRAAMINSGLAADAITGRGAGESRPVKQCPNETGAALKACLAPNRRVEIEVADTGTS